MSSPEPAAIQSPNSPDERTLAGAREPRAEASGSEGHDSARRKKGLSAGLREDLWAYALAALAAVLFLAPYWLKRAQPIFDIRDYVYPIRFYMAQAYRSGELPLWLPHQFLGVPLVTDPSAQPFYPPTVLFSLLTGYGLRALAADLGFHYFLCIALAYRCCRDQGISWAGSFAAGLVYGLNGFLLFHAEHLNWVSSAAWLPLLVLCVRRGVTRQSMRWFVFAGAALGLLILGGYPPFFITSIYALPFLAAPWSELDVRSGRSWARVAGRTAVRSAVVVGVAVLLAGIQLVPTALGRSLMSRGAPLSLERAMEGGFVPELLSSLVLQSAPLAMSALSASHQYFPILLDVSICSSYVGLIALVLAGVGLRASRQARWVGLGGLVFLLLAFGGELWVRPFTFFALPMMGVFRFSSLFMLFFNLALIHLLGWGVDVLREGAPGTLRPLVAWSRRVGVGALAGWLGTLLLAAWLLLIQEKPLSLAARQTLRNFGLDLFFLGALLLGFAAALSARRRGGLGSRGLGLVLCVLLAADLSVLWYRFFSVCAGGAASPDVYRDIGARQREARARIWVPERKEGGGSIVTDKASLNRGIFAGRIEAWGYNSYFLQSTVSYVNADDFRLLQGDWVYLAGDPRVPADAVVSEGDFRREPLAPGEGVPEARFGGRSAHFTVNARQPRLLVLLQTAYPGWRATVDGEPRPVRTVSGQFIGLEVPPGQHTVDLRFVPPGWRVGCAATLLGALLLLLAFAPGLIPSRWRQRFAALPLMRCSAALRA